MADLSKPHADPTPAAAPRSWGTAGDGPDFGPAFGQDTVAFRLWAPLQAAVSLVIGDKAPVAMAAADGWFTATAPIAAGTRYRFQLGDGTLVPDPSSRRQAEDVHGASEVVDPAAFRWTDTSWRGRRWTELILYELHVGTFTKEGTFTAATARLAYLKTLGVTAIELMPIGDFPGRWNWGYDGVLMFAPDTGYGRPDDLKALVDTAHSLGIAVLLDVVYNHFGPEGNYLPAMAPAVTDRHVTPWGDAVNFEDGGAGSMRNFVLANVRQWIGDYHLDGLRIDAAHEIRDDEQAHVLSDIAAAAQAAAGGRHIHLVLESANLEAGRIAAGGPFAAQWNDDLHHSLHAAATGECNHDYGTYLGRPDILARSLAEGFSAGTGFDDPAGLANPGPAAQLPPTAFVAFLQNHDQVGNRARGERIHCLAPVAANRAAAAAYLLSPQIPMLFQGEEWASSSPFPFFSDLAPPFTEQVRAGRLATFFGDPDYADPARLALVPDPAAEATFLSAKLDWSERQRPGHAGWLDWYRSILRTRRRWIVPLLAEIRHGGDWSVDGPLVRVSWRSGAKELAVTLNLSAAPVALPAPIAGKVIWQQRRVVDGVCQPWFVAWTVRNRRWAGAANPAPDGV